ncbi:hypothetical protein DAERI_140133 [Deinococcus aerius]|uniref:Uncharacterized protein n=1 Tax=Deinococcus aerius TaxID=200253 RepID=A0A2I9CZ42_9DEIO|nr:hypothetical protein [Deinococcus aerius]GBF07472.1 hypothetical protein DAERI_140133 [Deinococcus aerius]
MTVPLPAALVASLNDSRPCQPERGCGLRAFDAVHFAAAQAVSPLGVQLMTFDLKLRAVAEQAMPGQVWQSERRILFLCPLRLPFRAPCVAGWQPETPRLAGPGSAQPNFTRDAWGEFIKQKRHSRAVLRHQRGRYIRRRLRYAYAGEWRPKPVWAWWYRVPGQASKNNTVCSCGLCRAEKYRDKPRQRWWDEE